MQRALILVAMAATPITARHSSTAASHALVSAAVCVSSPTGRPVAHEIQLKTSDGLKLTASFYEPKKRSPGAVLVHDAGASREELSSIAEKLYKQGFGVLTFDIRGHGDSKSSKTDWAKLDKTKRKTLWAQGMRDVRAAADWLLEQKIIHSTSLSLLGHGSGCALVARHAKEDENVISLTLLAPREEDMGFDVRGDIEDLTGLPTYVVTPRKNGAATMVNEANARAGGHPYIELLLATQKADTVLDDRKVPGKVSHWMSEVANPRKGRH